MLKDAHRSDPPTDLDPSRLGDVAAEIGQAFPLVTRRTGLVLFDVDPGHIQAQWQVEPDHLDKARGAFPPGASDVQPVLRLLRVDAPAGEQDAAVLSRALGASEVEGTARFKVSDHGAIFLAELGLASSDGGWLLLARSNQIRLPHPIARPIPMQAGLAARPPQPPQPVQSPATFGHVAQPDHHRGLAGSLQGVDRGVGHAVDRPSTPFDATLADSGARLAPVFPQPLQPAAWSPEKAFQQVNAALRAVGAGGESVPLPVSSSVPGKQLLANGRSEAADGRAPLVAAQSDGELPPHSSARGNDRDLPEFPAYDPFAGVSSRTPIGSSAPRPDFELRAEVVVTGRAEPGTLIDLFGQGLTVGADGRFMLRRALDDPSLLGLVIGGWPRPTSAGPETE